MCVPDITNLKSEAQMLSADVAVEERSNFSRTGRSLGLPAQAPSEGTSSSSTWLAPSTTQPSTLSGGVGLPTITEIQEEEKDPSSCSSSSSSTEDSSQADAAEAETVRATNEAMMTTLARGKARSCAGAEKG